MGTPEDDDWGYYSGATRDNENPQWMDDAKGNPVMGDGVKANLTDLTGYSTNLDHVSSNFSHLTGLLTDPLTTRTSEAFGGAEGGPFQFKFSGAMALLSTHNITELTTFFTNMATGVRNVAMAAQAVANAYGSTDETSAANMNAVNFAFGLSQKAPPGFPPRILEHLSTYNDYMAKHPYLDPNVQAGRVPGATIVDDHHGTITVTLADGTVIKTSTTSFADVHRDGTTKSVYMNGKLMSETTTTNDGYSTTTVTSQTSYGKDNKPTTRVTSRSTTTTTTTGGVETTTQSTTTYTLDDDGKEVPVTNTAHSSVGTGDKADYTDPVHDDPATNRIMELSPKPSDSSDSQPNPTPQPTPSPPTGTTTTTTTSPPAQPNPQPGPAPTAPPTTIGG